MRKKRKKRSRDFSYLFFSVKPLLSISGSIYIEAISRNTARSGTAKLLFPLRRQCFLGRPLHVTVLQYIFNGGKKAGALSCLIPVQSELNF